MPMEHRSDFAEGSRIAMQQFSLVLVGSGFASSFFLHEYLGRAGPSARVLVLERGPRVPHAELSRDRERLLDLGRASFHNRTPDKPWPISLGFGGGSNCWWACTPRLLPEDFRLRSRHGVGRDWPIGYDDLEEYYCRAEELMAVAGSHDNPAPRSRPYPLPPHRLSLPDEQLKAAYPDLFFVQPTARPSRQTAKRPQCCANGVCGHCPIDSKFTIQNEMAGLYADPRVELLVGARVRRVVIENDRAVGLQYEQDGAEVEVRGDLVALGAGGLHNPHLLLRSGLEHPWLGRGLHEQVAASVDVHLDGLDNFQGSTSICGHGYMLYAGDHRKARAAALMESWNVPRLRRERGKWRQFLRLKFIFEDLPRRESAVTVDPDAPERPAVEHAGISDYTRAGIEELERVLPHVLAPLPVEDFTIHERLSDTEAHVLGTTMMGDDPEDSVIDADLLHHRVRNLAVLGSGAFPAGSPANPTLTLCALSLRSAERLMRPGASA